ncbi:MAG: hypothetical protein P4N60_11095 [Verrucomicrobiae bacterium]|nr:hypothetical protein [Verrucomicrobiae bacterium]
MNNFFMRPFFCILAAAALLCGCAAVQKSPPPFIVGSPQDYGQFPTNSEHLVKLYIKAFFRDPDSTRDVNVGEPRKDFLNVHTAVADAYFLVHSYPNNAQIYGYRIPFWANSKNGFGGYTGSQVHYLFVRDNDIIDCLDSDSTYIIR